MIDSCEILDEDKVMSNRKKVGLALGSGGARGLAHIGVIKALLEAEIPIDVVVGASMGAFVGGLYAAWGDINRLEAEVLRFGYKEWMSMFFDPVWGSGLIKGDKIEKKLKEMVEDMRIEDLRLPFGAVATDLNTAEVVVIDKGDLARGIRASGSVPLLFEPVMMGGRHLVDGGVSCPVPVEIARQMGADVVIAVNLDSVYFLPENRNIEISSPLSILKNSLFLLKYHLAEKEVRESDVVINPLIPYVKDLDFINKAEIITGGEEATRKMMSVIKKLLV